jgi:HlyD family secretion protein
MIARIVLVAAALALGACSKAETGQMQGWVEADFVFVGPDEAGRCFRSTPTCRRPM